MKYCFILAVVVNSLCFGSDLTQAAQAYSQAVEAYMHTTAGQAEHNERLALRSLYQTCSADNASIAKIITQVGSHDLQHRIIEEWISKNEAGMLPKSQALNVSLDAFIFAAQTYDQTLLRTSELAEFRERQKAHERYHTLSQQYLQEHPVDALVKELQSAGISDDDIAIGRLKYWNEKR